ncbi:transposase [Streptomyces sp. NBC_00076]
MEADSSAHASMCLESVASGLDELKRVGAEQQARRRLIGRHDSQHRGRGIVRVARLVSAAVDAPGAQRLAQLVVVGDHTGCADHRATGPVGPSSEVAAMVEGLLRHCTDAGIESNYVDTHGASVVGFAFTELLNFRLLPRLKNIGSIRFRYTLPGAALYRGEAAVSGDHGSCDEAGAW